MRHLSIPLLVAAIILTWTGIASAESTPEFKLGFKALADQIPDIVGQPLEDEHYGPNGDSLQQTTTGLMVWRKADNWTAFTDGTRTWVNGPNGVQDRPNDMRFAWENEQPAAPPPPTTFTPQIKAMDTESGGPGTTVKRLMAEIDSDWASVWGWRPSRPVTVYLFVDGFHMTLGMPAITGQSLTEEQRRDYAANVPALNSADVQTGGWAIILNLSNGMGTPDWETITKATLVRQYSYVMERDAAGDAGPSWYREGLVRVSAEARVPADPTLRGEMAWMYDSKKRGILPTLTRLNQDWAGFVSISANYRATANSMAFMAVRILADKVGMGPLLEVLRRTAGGQDFETVLNAVTGYTVAQLDAQLQSKLQ